LAGGHFKQSVESLVLNKVLSKQDMHMKVLLCDKIASCGQCGIEYVRYHVSHDVQVNIENNPKVATTFPENIKSRFHEYVKTLFDVASKKIINPGIQCLSVNDNDGKIVYLLRHKAALFKDFSDESSKLDAVGDVDAYVSLVVFNEAENIQNIWTCHLLGVFTVDWSHIANYVLGESDSNIKFCGVDIERNVVMGKLVKFDNDLGVKLFNPLYSFSVATDSIKSKYMFEEHEDIFHLIDLETGGFLKITSRELMASNLRDAVLAFKSKKERDAFKQQEDKRKAKKPKLKNKTEAGEAPQARDPQN
jgi:hypothetical protein